MKKCRGQILPACRQQPAVRSPALPQTGSSSFLPIIPATGWWSLTASIGDCHHRAIIIMARLVYWLNTSFLIRGLAELAQLLLHLPASITVHGRFRVRGLLQERMLPTKTV